jgi:hypothetical protein
VPRLGIRIEIPDMESQFETRRHQTRAGSCESASESWPVVVVRGRDGHASRES